MREILGPIYSQDQRKHCPQCFIMSDQKYWNDILNNYKTPLGAYQFKRMLFAKTFLYSPNQFDDLFKFAISREPIDRAKSMFFYLFRAPIANIPNGEKERALPNLFTAFLNCIEEARNSPSNTEPYGVHFQTHTADMYTDISDDTGSVLVDGIWRLENLHMALEAISEIAGIEKKLETSHLQRQEKMDFSLNDSHIKAVRHLFEKDFDIYENAS